jgi:hypothetical protein
VLSEGVVGVLRDLLHVTVGALYVMTNTAQIAFRTVARLAGQPHWQKLRRPVHRTVAV